MSLPDPIPNLNPEAQHLAAVSAQEERKRRKLLLGLLLLLLGLCAVLYLGDSLLLEPGSDRRPAPGSGREKYQLSADL